MRFEGLQPNLLSPPAGTNGTNGRPHRKPGIYLSPALARAFGGPPAFEMKFQLDPARAERVEHWARRHLSLDPFADPQQGDGYRVHTLYFDTPAGDLFRRVPGHARHKFRVRRYGSESVVYLERKTRVGDRVMKRRTRIDSAELGRLLEPVPDPTWAGHWYWRRLAFRKLRPASRLSYDRAAFVAAGANGSLRLTLDRRVQCSPADGLLLGELSAPRLALDGVVIVELKFRAAMPAPFKALLLEMELAPRSTSKYRLGVAAWNKEVP
jgi:hypothetical protein